MKVKRAMFLILILALMLRLAAFWYFTSIGGPDTWEPEQIAKNIISGRGFTNTYLHTTYRSHDMPMHPFICAGIYTVFGVNHAAVVIFQILVSLCVCVVVFDIGRRVANETIGLLAAFLCAIHPGLIVYATGKLHPLSLDAFFIALTLWAFIYLAESLNVKRSLLAGFIIGLCILTRSTIVGFIPVGILWLFKKLKTYGMKAFIINVSIVVLTIVATISPWVIRNLYFHKTFVLTTSADMEVLWRGNNPNATGSSYLSSGKRVIQKDKALYQELISTDEMGQRNIFRREAFKFIRENPGKFVRLYFKKLYYFWWFSPASGTLYPLSYLVIYKYTYGLFVVFAGIGCYGVIARRVRVHLSNFNLLLMLLLSFSLFQSLFYVEGRHRWGVEPVLLVLSAIGIVQVLSKVLTRREVK